MLSALITPKKTATGQKKIGESKVGMLPTKVEIVDNKGMLARRNSMFVRYGTPFQELLRPYV